MLTLSYVELYNVTMNDDDEKFYIEKNCILFMSDEHWKKEF